MILDYYYDKVLWLLKKSSKKNNENICELVNYISDEVYKEIQERIAKYYKGTLDNVKDDIIFNKTIVNDDGYECYIVVKINKGRLYLNLYRWKEELDRIEEEYELVLRDIELEDMYYFDKKLIGEYSSEVNQIDFIGYGAMVNTYDYNRCFYLKRVPFGYVIISSIGRIPLRRKIVNVNRKMPKEINRDDFSIEDKNIKKRIRIKKK